MVLYMFDKNNQFPAFDRRTNALDIEKYLNGELDSDLKKYGSRNFSHGIDFLNVPSESLGRFKTSNFQNKHAWLVYFSCTAQEAKEYLKDGDFKEFHNSIIKAVEFNSYRNKNQIQSAGSLIEVYPKSLTINTGFTR